MSSASASSACGLLCGSRPLWVLWECCCEVLCHCYHGLVACSLTYLFVCYFQLRRPKHMTAVSGNVRSLSCLGMKEEEKEK